MDYSHVFKANPYHDEKGRFSTKDKYTFVSLKGFAKLRQGYVPNAANAKRTFRTMYDGEDGVADPIYESAAAAHATKLRDTPPPEMYASVKQYTSSNYQEVNSALRKPQEHTERYIRNIIGHMDTALEQTSAPDDMQVFRGMGGPWASTLKRAHEAGTLVGSTLHDPGYTSTSVNRSVADDFAYKGVLMEINVPKGSKGILAEGFTSTKSEHEFILPRGTSMSVSKATVNDKGKLILSVDILPVERRTRKDDFGFVFD